MAEIAAGWRWVESNNSVLLFLGIIVAAAGVAVGYAVGRVL